MWDAIFSIPPGQFLTFLIGGLIVNFAPGQDMVFATACGIQGGPKVGAMAGFGAGVGVLWHVTLAALGLSALVAAYPAALSAIRYAGAAYLLYIAWKSWRAGALPEGRGVPSLRRAFLRGVLSNMLNPKPILFFLAFLPQFVDPARAILPQFLTLGIVFSLGGLMVNGAVGIFAGSIGQRVARSAGLARWLSRISATIFGALALRLALMPRN